MEKRKGGLIMNMILEVYREAFDVLKQKPFRLWGISLLAGFLGRGAALATVAVVIGCIIFLNYAYSGLSTADGIEQFETMYINFASYLPADRTWVDGFWSHFLVVSAVVYLIILATVLIGTAIPAWRISRSNIVEAIKE